jgi:UDP-N-acetylglucosamine 2-epimerase (non-hydrolysing)
MNIHARPAARFACVMGTRPEVIKMAPLVEQLRQADWADCFVVTTGQQDDLLRQALADFDLAPDIVIPHASTDTDVVSLLSSLLKELAAAFDKLKPDCVIAQGDTTSVYAAAVAAFYRKIPFVHIEAGLRTRDVSQPFPEEFHRRAVAVATALHCAPTQLAAQNLQSENIPADRIFVSGNTVIDALLGMAGKATAPGDFPAARYPILLTAHRRESFGTPLRDIFAGIRDFVERTPDSAVYFPVHPNPNAQDAAYDVLSDHPRITLTKPLSYREMVGAMQKSWLILTDSGGLQEEGPALGKPVLVLREVTERPEAVDSGVAGLAGVSQHGVLQALLRLRDDKAHYDTMARPAFPFGDGRAAERIKDELRRMFAGYEHVSDQNATVSRQASSISVGSH